MDQHEVKLSNLQLLKVAKVEEKLVVLREQVG